MSGAVMSGSDVERIEGALFFEPPEMRARLTRFTMLILFASIIATGGLLSDSVASIIGAMIIAPLMTPIMGMVVAIVIGSQARLFRSAIIVLAGIALAISVGWLMATLMPHGWLPSNSDQVMSRTSPQLLDLVVALASGGAGAYALSRVEVADALPGDAIAISLVPPLNTVGILLAGGRGEDALGAMILFLTNIGAILLAGTITFLVTGLAAAVGRRPSQVRNALFAICVFVALIAIPLRANSHRLWADATHEEKVLEIVHDWIEPTDWEVYAVNVDGNLVEIALGGDGELPPTDDVIAALNEEFDGDVEVTARIVNTRKEVLTSTPESVP